MQALTPDVAATTLRYVAEGTLLATQCRDLDSGSLHAEPLGTVSHSPCLPVEAFRPDRSAVVLDALQQGCAQFSVS
jgi:hypothetical protein